MAFLELNGVTVPILRGGQQTIEETGKRSRAVDGSYQMDRRVQKRSWKFSTTTMGEMQAEMIKGILQGDGFLWPFDTDTYSSNGAWSSTGEGTIRRGYANHDSTSGFRYPVKEWVSGSLTVDEARPGRDEFFLEDIGADYLSNSSGGISCNEATVNLLPADSRDAENAPTGYNAAGGGGTAVTGDTTTMWQGLRSVKCVTDAVGGGSAGGLYTDNATVSGSTVYRGSVYLLGGLGSEQVTVYLYDGFAYSTGVTVTLPARTWVRVHESMTTNASATAMSLWVLETVDGSNITFYADGFQIEQQDRYATSWVDGTRATASSLFYYPTILRDFGQDFTINLWNRFPLAQPASGLNQVVLSALHWGPNAPNGQFFRGAAQIYRPQTSDNTIFDFKPLDGTQWAPAVAGLADGDWHMLTMVQRADPESGETNAYVYVNGTLSTSNTLSNPVELAKSNLLTIGHGAFNTDQTNGVVDDVQILPYAVDADQVSAWYNRTTGMPYAPRIELSGDCIPDETFVEVIGRVTGIKYNPQSDAGTWRKNAQRVEFELYEA